MPEHIEKERREGYCPVHHIKCSEIKELQTDSKKRVPVWVFTLFAVAVFGVVGWFNLDGIRRNKEVLESLSLHMNESSLVFERTTRILSRATHALNEVAFNQRNVMKKLELDFQPIPDYEEHY
ncbi:MAG: hypothetical protein HKM94_11255, partial [Halobacteria archaeon]|nr:hypothetical protein [Halobacteria archaeon]